MKIVYYIYINLEKDWKSIISGQINDLKTVGLIPFAELYCVICTENKIFFDECVTLIQETAICEHSTKNQYEYPGLKKLHDLGNIYPDSIFLYMHSKGMVFHNQKGRNTSEMKLLRNTINNWKYLSFIFNNYPEIDKAGLFPDYTGIFWFNFFWVRGSFLKSIPPPIIITDRYYYENQFIKNKECKNNCFNLLYFNKQMNSVPNMACRHLELLNSTFEKNILIIEMGINSFELYGSNLIKINYSENTVEYEIMFEYLNKIFNYIYSTSVLDSSIFNSSIYILFDLYNYSDIHKIMINYSAYLNNYNTEYI